ncbi:MAG: GatB/YqeY domain-containing protein [Alphaproteobacteria bacterium]|nr:GatB/YqeY domain-containing protein [Alphaproteobacteria bacterium]
MLREKFTADLKTAMLAKDEAAVGAIRLIIAAMKQKDIDSRTAESREGISDAQILALLQSMIKQRNESIEMYKKGNRQDLADKEQAEIKIIERYLPQQMSDDEMKAAVAAAIAAAGASGIKDMGKVMGELKAKYTGQMDFAKAGAVVKEKLAG